MSLLGNCTQCTPNKLDSECISYISDNADAGLDPIATGFVFEHVFELAYSSSTAVRRQQYSVPRRPDGIVSGLLGRRYLWQCIRHRVTTPTLSHRHELRGYVSIPSIFVDGGTRKASDPSPITTTTTTTTMANHNRTLTRAHSTVHAGARLADCRAKAGRL